MTERLALYCLIAFLSISCFLSYRSWQLGHSAIRLLKVCSRTVSQGIIWAISTGVCLQVGIAQRCPASTKTSLSNCLGIAGLTLKAVFKGSLLCDFRLLPRLMCGSFPLLLTQVVLSTLTLLLLRLAPYVHQQAAGFLCSVCDAMHSLCCKVLPMRRLKMLLAL